MGSDATRSASRGLKGCVGGGDNGTPARRARRSASLKMYARFGGISAGPLCPHASSIAAKSTGTGSTARPCRAASSWIWVQARYAYGEMKST